MANSNRPPFDADTLEEIAECQGMVHKDYYAQLAKMKAGPDHKTMLGLLIAADATPTPPEPKLPIKLCKILTQYAISLFNCEVTRYDLKHPDLNHWIRDLIRRTETIVMESVNDIDKHGSLKKLTHHASYQHMRAAVKEGLKSKISGAPQPSFRQLLKVASGPIALAKNIQAKPNNAFSAPPKTISERLDDAVLKENISHEEQAVRIGIGRSTYFEVKKGGGGRKSKRSVELYLSRTFSGPNVSDSD